MGARQLPGVAHCCCESRFPCLDSCPSTRPRRGRRSLVSAGMSLQPSNRKYSAPPTASSRFAFLAVSKVDCVSFRFAWLR